MKPTPFLARLEQEASIQARLHDARILPPQLDLITTLVGRYPWQTLSVLAITTSAILEILPLLAMAGK